MSVGHQVFKTIVKGESSFNLAGTLCGVLASLTHVGSSPFNSPGDVHHTPYVGFWGLHWSCLRAGCLMAGTNKSY